MRTDPRPRLDVEAFDDAASDALAAVTLDLPDIRLRADRRRRGAVRRRWAGASALAAAAVVLGLLAVPALTARIDPPTPADVPAGPGALPDTLYLPPVDTFPITTHPISRVAYVLSVNNGVFGYSSGDPLPSGPDGYVLVGADRGEYRLLPGWPTNLVLSDDGTALAWVSGDLPTVVSRLEVRTGRVTEVVLPGRFGQGMSVDTLAFGPGARSLLVGASSRMSSNTAGEPEVLRVAGDGSVSQVCDCWRLLGATRDGVPVVDGGEGAVPGTRDGAVLVGPQQPLETGPHYGSAEVPSLSPDGTARYGLSSPRDGSTEATVFTLTVRRGAAASDETVELGTHMWVRLAATTGDGVLVQTADHDPDLSWFDAGPREVALVGPDGSTRLTRVDAPTVDVVLAARDVVEGGRVVPGVRPAGAGVGDPAWWSRRLAAAWPDVAWLGGAALLVLALWAQGTEPGSRLVRRLLPTRRGLGRGGVAFVLVAGVALVALPGLTARAWDAAEPVTPQRDAGFLLPSIVRDQRVPARPVFSQNGVPRTRAIHLAFVGTVAGRSGVYGLDATTMRVVRLDTVPGAEESRVVANDPPTRVALSPNGRFVALWGTSGTAVVVVDLQAARATRSPATLGTNPVDPLPELGVLDDGSLVTVDGNGRATRTRPDGTTVAFSGSATVYAVAVQPQGQVLLRRLAAGRAPGEAAAAVVDAGSGRVVRELPDVTVEPAALLPGGRLALVTSGGGVLTVLPKSGEPSRPLGGSGAQDVVSSSDGHVFRIAQEAAGRVVQGFTDAAGSGEALTTIGPVRRTAPQTLALAPDVLAAAARLDVTFDVEPGWTRLADPRLRWLGGAVVALGAALGWALRRRHRV